MVTYKGFTIEGRDGEYRVVLHNGHKSPLFRNYAECEQYIDGLRY